MSLRSRLSIATAAGLLAAAAAVTPATAAAHDDWDPTGGNGNHHHDPSGGNGHHHDPSGGNGHHDPRLYKGVVTANTLALRSAPNRGSQIIRYAHKGVTPRTANTQTGYGGPAACA
ncbi:hypothetical protein ABZZ16_44255, partial [Streptomyces sp. NPDC006386]